MTNTDIIAEALGLQAPDIPTYDCDTNCATTGVRINRGYRTQDVVTEATNDIYGIFGGDLFGYVSESAAKCFCSANPRLGNPAQTSKP